MSFGSMAAEVATWIPTSDLFLAGNLVNEAWRKIQDEREWTFLLAEGTLYSPGILTGLCSVTLLSTSVTLDATASAAVLPFVAPTVAATSPLSITNRQFRIGAAGEIFNIVAADAAVPTAIVLTLDRIYTLSTNSAASFQIYRCYYQPTGLTGLPTNDFKSWTAIKVPAQAYCIAGMNLYRTSVEVSVVDPQRSSQGQPYWVCSYKTDPLNNYGPLYELWPHPTAEQGYPTLYVRRAPDFTSPSDTVPAQISERLIICKALSLLAEWADMNKGIRPELQKTNWTNVKINREVEYKKQLDVARKLDNSQFITNWIGPRFRGGIYFPYDSSFMQNHDVGGLGWGGG